MLLTNMTRNSKHTPPPMPIVANIFALYFIVGGNTMTPAIANANKTNTIEKVNKIAVSTRFSRNFKTSCLMKTLRAGKTLRAPEKRMINCSRPKTTLNLDDVQQRHMRD
jgi:hypothetical protein